MTEEERIEFRDLKRIRSERGFWLSEEEKRWNYLFDIHSLDFKLKAKQLDLIYRQQIEN